MSTLQISFAPPEAAGATLSIPETASRELLETMAQALAVVLRALRKGEAGGQHGRPDGEAEYASWFAGRAGELEYASWFPQPRR